MKNFTHFIILVIPLLITTSCKNIEKLMEQGRYDDAFEYGANQLIGKKNKKTKYVKALEEAYVKLNQRDNDRIRQLSYASNENTVDEIVSIYTRMAKRQNIITPLLPLISKDGYVANFNLVDYIPIINNAEENAVQVHYEILKELYTSALNGNKIDARNAYYKTKDIEYYNPNYKNTREIKENAYNLGQTNILIETYAEGYHPSYFHTDLILSQINNTSLNTKWTKFFIHDDNNFTYDYIATIEIQSIFPGKEVYNSHTYTEEKSIKIGSYAVKDIKGNVKKDSTGATIMRDKFELVKAEVTKVTMNKFAEMIGRVVITDPNRNVHISTLPITVDFNFEDISYSFHGDKRALTKEVQNKLKGQIQFPTDYEMTQELAIVFKEASLVEIRNSMNRII